MSGGRYYVVDSPAPSGRQPASNGTVVIPGVSMGGPQRLTGDLIDHLITAERAGEHTVVLASDVSDLDAGPAQVCRYLVTDDAATAEEAGARYGTERVLQVPSAAVGDVGEWIGRLPRPESRSLRRRIRRVVRNIPFAQAVYGRIASKP